MRFRFSNDRAIDIDPDSPSVYRSPIDVDGLDGTVEDVDVTVRFSHENARDLVMILENPAGRRVLLVAQQGGSGDDYDNTTFDDEADATIRGAAAPFRGSFRPERELAAFDGSDPNGRWTLLFADNRAGNGGQFLGWDLELEVPGPDTEPPDPAEQQPTPAPPPTPPGPESPAPKPPTPIPPSPSPPPTGLDIEVRFLGGLTRSQQAVFTLAAARWSEVIVEGGPPVRVGGERVDGVRIDAQGSRIDGRGGILGQAGPTAVRPRTLLPATGIMQFDVGDLARLEADGGLLDVIVHEMGHVLGIGTLWSIKGLIAGSGSANPRFMGAGAAREFAILIGSARPQAVPVANTGGAGTREGHWRESVFGSELMTGFLDEGENPLSRLTVASLGDLGYEVDLSAADPYALPTSLDLAIRGFGAEGDAQRCCTLDTVTRPVPVVLTDDALDLGEET